MNNWVLLIGFAIAWVFAMAQGWFLLTAISGFMVGWQVGEVMLHANDRNKDKNNL